MIKTLNNLTLFLKSNKGISAALLMSGTYSTARFAFYEYFKAILLKRARRLEGDYSINDLPFYQKFFIAGAGGAVGAIVGIILIELTTISLI